MGKVEVVCDGTGVFIIVDGVMIAKRGEPGTRHAKTWVSLEPGWAVRSPDDHSTIEIEHEGVRIQ